MSFILTYRKPRSHSKSSNDAISYDRLFAKTIKATKATATATTVTTTTTTTTATTTSKAVSIKETLLAFEALPEWCQDNPFVRAGYRPISNSYRVCASTCFNMHNETMNIFTHLIPAIGLMVAQYYVQLAITNYFPEATMGDRIILGANVLAAIITFTLSACYHTLMCHSSHVSSLWLRIDYVGILTLILGSFLTGVYVGFYCEPTPRAFHWSMISILSVMTATLVLHPNLQGPKYRPHKAYAFIATAMTGFAPIFHGLYLYGWDEMWVKSGMPYWFLEGIIYLIGAFFFITRFPESVWPGSFDIYFNSHSIFHVFVVCASFVHMYGVWSAFAWNYEHSRTCAARLG